MLSAYSGVRLNGVCQLNVLDIQKTDGIWLMNLKLLELEFLSYFEQIRHATPKKLFPILKK